MTRNESINPISNIITNFLLKPEVCIFSNIFLFLSPILYMLIYKITSEGAKQLVLVAYILILLAIITLFVGILIKKYIDKESVSRSTEKLDKKTFF
jgi:positive regulator of sigma E activity